MVAELQPLRAYPCTKEGCANSFDTLKEMKYHKVAEPDHFYCKKCDVDCIDWDDLTQHKVDKMAPYLEGKMKGSGEAPKHIVCEFCGEDFKSFGGRKLHRDMNHKANQNILCPGCKNIFVRAAHMVAHLERNECEQIRAHQFRSHTQQKYVLKEIMKQPDVFAQNLSNNKALAPSVEKPGLVLDSPTQSDDEGDEGGVSLIDRQDEEQKGGDEPLQAEVDLIDLHGNKISEMRRTKETWPRLPTMGASLSGSMRSMSINSSAAPSVSGTNDSDITSGSGGAKVHIESYPSIRSSRTPSTAGSDAGSVSTTIAETFRGRTAAWNTTQTSRALFSDAKPTPPEQQTRGILKKRADETAPPNLFTAHFWDPFSKDYNPDIFFHSVLERYCCPFPACDIPAFELLHELEDHIMDFHCRTKFRCPAPACYKIFKSASALVAHAEANGNCKVGDTKNFEEMLNEITGGFLKAKRLPQPAIYRPETDLVRQGQAQMPDGVMKHRYKAKMPEQD